MKNNNILVSVIVVSYNSEKTIEETLNSIKSQSYDNIELIISDDGSKDNTIDICKRWLQINGKVFSCYQLITVELNSGIPANCNRSLKASNADWVKFIAGDDTLKRDCVKENVKYINLHNDI